MRKMIMSTVAVMTLGLAPAWADDHAPAAAAEATAATEMAAPEAAEASDAVTASLVSDVVSSSADHKTLAAALASAGLVETLQGAGPFTLFAPTDSAFAKLDPAVLADLLKPENKDKLVQILTYHVVPGNIAAADAKGATVDLVTVNQATLKVDGTGDVVKVGEATVTQADVAASNGVIHVIDTVLLPPASEPAAE